MRWIKCVVNLWIRTNHMSIILLIENFYNSNEVLSLTADTQITELSSDVPRFMLIYQVKTPISSQKMLERFAKNLILSSIYSDYVVIQCKNRFDTFIDTSYSQYTLVVTENTMRHFPHLKKVKSEASFWSKIHRNWCKLDWTWICFECLKVLL